MSTALIPSVLASVSIINFSLKSGKARTGLVVIACFKVRNASLVLAVQVNLLAGTGQSNMIRILEESGSNPLAETTCPR